MLDIIAEFMLELIRSLLVDEVSRHVRRGVKRALSERFTCSRDMIRFVQRRNRERLLHRLFTELEEDL
jgi:hypothetical protein